MRVRFKLGTGYQYQWVLPGKVGPGHRAFGQLGVLGQRVVSPLLQHGREQLDFARILYGKGMYMQALKILERIKQTALEHQQDILHLVY